MKKLLMVIISVVMMIGSSVTTMADIADANMELLICTKDSGVFNNGVEGTYTVVKAGTTTVVDSGSFTFTGDQVKHTPVIENFVKVNGNSKSEEGDVISVILTKPIGYSGEITCEYASSRGNYALWVEKADGTGGGGSTGGGSTGGGSGGSSNPIVTSSNKTIDSSVGKSGITKSVTDAISKAVAAGEKLTNISVTFKNYNSLTPDGLKAINDTAADKNNSLDLTVHFDKTVGNAVSSRISVDPVAFAKVMTEKVALGVHFDQAKDSTVKTVNGMFGKYFSNKIVTIVYDQRSTLAANVEFCAKLGLDEAFGTDKQLYFYTYDNVKNTYASIVAPNYFVDSKGFDHITAPFGGSIIVSDSPMTRK